MRIKLHTDNTSFAIELRQREINFQLYTLTI